MVLCCAVLPRPSCNSSVQRSTVDTAILFALLSLYAPVSLLGKGEIFLYMRGNGNRLGVVGSFWWLEMRAGCWGRFPGVRAGGCSELPRNPCLVLRNQCAKRSIFTILAGAAPRSGSPLLICMFQVNCVTWPRTTSKRGNWKDIKPRPKEDLGF